MNVHQKLQFCQTPLQTQLPRNQYCSLSQINMHRQNEELESLGPTFELCQCFINICDMTTVFNNFKTQSTQNLS